MNEDEIVKDPYTEEIKEKLKILNSNTSDMMLKSQRLIIEATQIDPLFNLLQRSELEALYLWLKEQIKKSESETDKKIYNLYLQLIDNFINT